MSLLHIALPIGISFYTFQTMSYTIDVYRGEVAAQKNILTFATYVTLFPQLIAGPIVQYKTVEKELMHRKVTLEDFSEGAFRFSVGLAKKVLLANQIGSLWDSISQLNHMSVATAWLGAIAYSFQIYFDFSGYSDMAIGLGRMFGFYFLENFNFPYMSKTITEFWRRWHISLSSWFREYVYIPLGGNRKGLVRQLFNIMVVWMLTGLWHGANWNFVLWGVYYGVLLMIEKLFLLKWLDKLPNWIGHIYSMFLVVIGWTIFAQTDIHQLGEYLKTMFGIGHVAVADSDFLYFLGSNAVLLVALIAASIDYRVWMRRLKAGKGCYHLRCDCNVEGMDHSKAGSHGCVFAGVLCVSGRGQLQSVFIFPFFRRHRSLKKIRVTMIVIFVAFLALVSGGSLLMKDREFSPNENRYLAEPPRLTVDNILSGKFQDSLENYLRDQICFRDGWITVKTGIQKACKDTDIGGAYVGKDGYDFEKITPEDVDEKQIARNVKAVQDFFAKASEKCRKGQVIFFCLSHHPGW